MLCKHPWLNDIPILANGGTDKSGDISVGCPIARVPNQFYMAPKCFEQVSEHRALRIKYIDPTYMVRTLANCGLEDDEDVKDGLVCSANNTTCQRNT